MEHLDIFWVDVVPFCGHLSGRRLRPGFAEGEGPHPNYVGGLGKTTKNPTINAAKMVICVQVVTCCFSEIAKLTLFSSVMFDVWH